MITDYYKDTSYVSNSMIGRLLENADLFTKWVRGEYTYDTGNAFILGDYVHHHWLDHISDGWLNTFQSFETHVVHDIGDLRSQKNRERKKEIEYMYPNGNYIEISELQKAKDMVDALLNSKVAKDYVSFIKDNFDVDVEVTKVGYCTVYVQTNDGMIPISIPIKGKTDIVMKDQDGIVRRIADLKTTRSLDVFRQSVWKYGYNRQAKHYTELFDLNLEDDTFDFIAIGKDDHRIKIFKTDSENFIKGANSSFEYGMTKYHQWKTGDELSLLTERL